MLLFLISVAIAEDSTQQTLLGQEIGNSANTFFPGLLQKSFFGIEKLTVRNILFGLVVISIIVFLVIPIFRIFTIWKIVLIIVLLALFFLIVKYT